MRVLLVEDDPTTSKSIEMMLTHANLNTYATDLGEEGIDLAKLYDYDLILLDLDLPDMNGHEVLRQLRLSRIETPCIDAKRADRSGRYRGRFGRNNISASAWRANRQPPFKETNSRVCSALPRPKQPLGGDEGRS